MTTINRTSRHGSRKLDYFGGNYLQQEREKQTGMGLRVMFGRRFCEACQTHKPKNKRPAQKGWKCDTCTEKQTQPKEGVP